MTPKMILAYLGHARAVSALEQLEAAEIQALRYMGGPERRLTVERLQRLAAGLAPLTEAEEQARKQLGWDAAWARLRGQLGAAPGGRGQLAPGERIVIPEG